MNKDVRIKRGILYILFFAVLSFAILVSGCDTGLLISKGKTGDTQPLFDYRQIKLDNGLTVITLEDFSCPIVTAQVWYHVGSKNEQPDRQGYAHMFEHMMFKGTDRIGPKDHFGLLNKAGGTLNAYTHFDRTVYHETIPANQLELALWLEAERMNFLKIDQEAFDTERNVVLEELRMNENRPYGTLYKKLLAELYKKHPYRWTPIGQIAHLRATSVADLRAFWKKYYVPSNAALVIVGAVEHEKAQSLAEKYFGWIPKYEKPEQVSISEPQWKESRKIIINDENAPTSQANLIWRTVPLGHEDEPRLDLLAEILGGGQSSRLYRDLVAEKQIAVDASASTMNLEDEGLFFTDATLAPGGDPNKLVEPVFAHVEKIRMEGVTEDELIKAKNQMLKSLVTQNLAINSKAEMLGSAAVEKGDTSRANTILDEIRAVTAGQIQAVAKKYLRDDRMVTLIVEENTKGMLAGQKDNEAAPVTAEPELQAPPPGRGDVRRPDDFPDTPPLGELVKDIPKPNFTEDKLPNGLKVMVVPNNEVPFISVKLGLINGAWTEQKPGTASMTMDMLTKGTENYTEARLTGELEKYAISLSGSASMDTASVNANCLTDHIDRAVRLLAEVTLRPAFDTEELQKLSKQVITSLSVQEQTPRYLADREFRKRMYGKHPYSRTVTGQIADVQALTTENLRQWWSGFLSPNQATIIFAGDISRDRALDLTKKYLGDWKIKPPKMITPSEAIPGIESRHIYLVNMPGSAQCEIRIGTSGVTRHDQPEYFISRLVSNYFGGSFNSRLNETIRVKKGLTYGARGGYYADRFAGSFSMSTFTKNESLAETIETMFDEVRRLKNEPPSDQEFYDTKSYIAGNFVLNREMPQQVADDLWLIESQQLADNYLEKLLSKISDTTKEECIELAKDTIDENKMIIVVTGDAEKIKEPLEKIAPVTVVQLD